MLLSAFIVQGAATVTTGTPTVTLITSKGPVFILTLQNLRIVNIVCYLQNKHNISETASLLNLRREGSESAAV